MTDHQWLEFYDDHVPPRLDYPRLDLYSLLSQQAAASADRPAVRFMGRTLTYARLIEHIDHFAGHLSRRGVGPGDRVMLLLPNCPQFAIAFYAVSSLGASLVLANPLNVERELIYKIDDSGAKAVIALDLLSQRVDNLKSEVDLDLIVYTTLTDFLPLPLSVLYPLKRRLDAGMPAVRVERDRRTFKFKDFLKKTEPPPRPAIDPEAMAALIYSGGTSGVSKGIMLSHYGLAVNARQLAAWVGLEGGDSVLGVMPLFHGFGLSAGLNAPLLHGGATILLPRFDALGLVKAVHHERPTLMAGVPTMFIAIKELPDLDRYDLTSLRGIFVGAAPLPRAVRDEFERRSGAGLIEGYGLTEAVSAVACNPYHGLRKPGTVGIPFPDVEWKIVDLESGTKDLAPGQAGEIVVRGPEMMSGYWNMPEETARIVRQGWLHTGDIGVMDEHGYVTIVDRIKDLIVVSGFNVYPSEIDEVLHHHPGVAEAVAVGLPHPDKGEYLKAYVVPKAGQKIDPEEVREFCAENLSPHLVPEEVEVRDALPRSLIGKVLRRTLREEELARQEAERR
ncbi:MAG: long-chain fatty acid--CoA ligase [Proteobacteria bacterium]|nr:long-chain fatty acid--CoA ligase [Pseudomonadota bacterium]MBU1740395.1 long-chain fatty acid--CoA ligase [Pseudomonadota bacterium]